MRKILFALAAASLMGASMAADYVGIKPSEMKSIKPIRVAKVAMNQAGKVVMRSGWVKYTENFGISRVGSLLYDNFEGDSIDNANPDNPTDGLYGEQYFFDGAEGTRWIRRAANYKNMFSVRGIEKLFAGGNGQEAIGADVLFNQNIDEPFLYALFTSDDPLTTTVPDQSTFSGIIYDFGQLAPGFYLSNIDLTDTGLFHTMPADGRGSYMVILASAYDEINNIITFSTEAQPGLWGTKPGNESQVSRYGYQDGKDDDGSQNGDFEADEYLDYKFLSTNNRQYNADAYSVTRGVEIGSNDPTKLANVDGTPARVQQRFQASPALANAEIVYGANYPADRDLTLTRTIRAYATLKANSLPFGDASCRLTMAVRNWTTGLWEVKLTTKPTIAYAEYFTYNISLPVNADYVRSSDRRVEVRVSIFHLTPSSPAWTMEVDQANVFFAYSGPIPLGQSVAFSKP